MIVWFCTSRHLGSADSNNSFPGLDKNKRATWRYVFLTLHKNDDKLINLLLHELAHTACNHVTYRDKDNHLADFDFHEQFLHEIYILSM